MRARAKVNFILSFVFASGLAVGLTPTLSYAQTCESLFKTAHVEEFLRVRNSELQNEVRNPAARAALVQMLARRLPKGSFNVDVDGRTEGLTVYADGRNAAIQMRLSSGHLMTTESAPLIQSNYGGAKGSRTGLAVQFQFLAGEKLVVTNTIISGDENTYLGLTKHEIKTEFDLSAAAITEIAVQETVTTTSVYKKDDTSYTLARTVKILSRR